MKRSTFTFTDSDGISIFVYKWEPEIRPKAVIQIVHGLAEHAKRYSRAAETFCNEGYICFANDQRGHGLTAGDLTEATLEGKAGVLEPNGWNGVVNDVHQLSGIIKKEYPDIPLFLLGHSWGAMVSQDYIQEWGNEINGCILSGTSGDYTANNDMENFVNREIKEKGLNTPNQELNDLIFKVNNMPWENDEGATGFEWLSRDKKEVQKYVDDPWCGFIAPASLWLEFFKGLEKIYDTENEQRIPKQLPIYFIAGALDPVGNKTIGLISMIKRLETYGIKDVSHKFYKNARHEPFNEINREVVVKDLINWLDSHL
ncbi:hypothetical protein LCGC14_0831970 [marine sediment metagenome]|uniref:Serine aminopeptidase S33 domain-containing protein n=1 Tax=marine sediment metagenome TaxID=412755 RepID=A0A0F9Q0X2_9ZZZZ|nr:MAG: Phospholipase YtpA [Candidatus Lokiarchaeum sp. GC14_75]HEC40978.1 alpha/beta hydrolase [bacterium]